MTDFISRNWFIILWLLFGLALAYGPRIRRWLRKQAAQSWPSAEAKIESVAVYKRDFHFWESDRNRPYVADLGYAFSAEGALNSGHLKQEFEDDRDAHDFANPLKGQTTIVRYKPGRPDISTVSDEELCRLRDLKLASPGDRPPDVLIQEWKRFLLVPLMILAGAGLALSVFFHISSFTKHPKLPEPFFFLMHIGAIALGFVLVFVLKDVPRGRQMELWKRLSPQWLRIPVYGFFGYAIINFTIFFLTGLTKSTSKETGPPSPMTWRGFSGHWMFFFAVEFATFYCAFRLRARKRCVNGHRVSGDAHLCATCGEAIR